MNEMEIASPEPALSDKTRLLRLRLAMTEAKGLATTGKATVSLRGRHCEGVSPKQSLFMYRKL